MIVYVYCDEDGHPIAEALTVQELSRITGKTANAIRAGIAREHSVHYFTYDTEDDDDEQG
ncbi:MAG: hypothetical protein IKD59_06120 [Lachnospiraceae bacterium]|nr:hypothetical protein [Lachnospiraceae bacterium]